MADNIVFRKLHEDSRGAIAQIDFHSKKFELIEFVKGAARGGHYHNVDSTFIVLYGKLIYQQMKPDEPASEEEKVMQSGDVQRTSAGLAHVVIALEDSIAVEFREGEYEVTNYPPYRRIVQDYLDRQVG